jgi:hypothetical protein
MSLTEENINIWRRFKNGETASSIAESFDRVGDVGVSTVLRIVLLVESEMATSHLFFEVEFDAEGCPVATRKEVVPPSGDTALEQWLRSQPMVRKSRKRGKTSNHLTPRSRSH